MLFCKIDIIQNKIKKMIVQTLHINISTQFYKWTTYQILQQQQFLKKQDILEDKRHTNC